MNHPSSTAGVARPAPSPLIRLDDVSKCFVGAGRQPDLVAVDRVSLTIDAGERFGIIGSSGAGKSTLLRLINLLETPDEGRVVVDDLDLTRLSRRALRQARAGIGMIFQQFNLLQNATVYDNVAFPLTIQRPRLSRVDQRLRVDECLKIVGLTGKRDAYPAQLSGGQKQRVAIARALATRPAVMLCDEPTSALDSETTRSVLDVLAEINERLDVTLVVVTHELAVARRLCERVVVMADGRIVEDIVMAHDGDRLDTAIARAVPAEPGTTFGGRPTAAVSATPAPVPRHRVGGLPLPAKTAPSVESAAASRVAVAARARVAADRWSRHLVFTPAAAWPAPGARRVGGLPLPVWTPFTDVPVAPPAAPPASRLAESTPRVRSWSRREEAVHV